MKFKNRQSGFDRCRALGHAWYETEADRTPPFGFYFWTACESCGTIRKDIRNRWGDLLARSYEYPDDYKDTEGHTRQDWYARLMAPRLPDVTATEKKLGRDLDALKERLREARRLQRATQDVIETTATEVARPSRPASVARPGKVGSVAVRKRQAA